MLYMCVYVRSDMFMIIIMSIFYAFPRTSFHAISTTSWCLASCHEATNRYSEAMEFQQEANGFFGTQLMANPTENYTPSMTHVPYSQSNNMLSSPLFRCHLALPLSSFLPRLLFIDFCLLQHFIFCDIMFGCQKTKGLHRCPRLFSQRVINDSLSKYTYTISLSIYEKK